MFPHVKRYVYLNHYFNVRGTISGVKWDVKVKVAGGVVTTACTGDVPDGEYVITGWDSGSGPAAALTSCAPGVAVGIGVGLANREE